MVIKYSIQSKTVLYAACLSLLLCLSLPLRSPAENATPEELGLNIARATDARAQGYGNFTARQTMVLRNKQGQESTRSLRVKVLEVEGDGDKSLFVSMNRATLRVPLFSSTLTRWKRMTSGCTCRR